MQGQHELTEIKIKIKVASLKKKLWKKSKVFYLCFISGELGFLTWLNQINYFFIF